MKNSLKVLLLEDSRSDAELVRRHLERDGLACEFRHVDNEPGFRDALRTFQPDIILSDYSLPGFNGLQALQIARELRPDVPYVFVTGTLGEATAIETVKSGAADYVLKSNLARLPAAVSRALAEHRERQARIAAERAQKESEALKSAIVEAALDCIISIDDQGRIIEFNGAAERTFGYPRAEALGSELAGLIVPPELREAHRRGMERHLRDGSRTMLGRRVEIEAMRRDGSRFPVELTVVPIRLDGKTIFSSHIRDISERREIESRLRDSEERYRRIVDLSPDAMTIHQDGRFVFVNPATARLLGVDNPARLIGRSVLDFLPPKLHDMVRARLKRLYEDHQPAPVLEVEMKREDGGVIYVETEAAPMLWHGRPAAQTVARDTTIRKLAEDRLRESEAKFRALIEQASDGIFITDAEGNFRLVNPRACELLGYSEGELLGLNGRETYLEEEQPLHSRRLEQVRAGEVLRFERNVKRRDGSAFPAEISLKMLDSGMMQVIFRDISTRREQEQRITRLTRIHQVLSSINSAIVRIRDRSQLLDEACRIAAEQGAFRLAWIGMLEAETGMLIPRAWGGFDAGFFDRSAKARRRLASSPMGVGARACSEGRTVIDKGVAANPGIDPIRSEAVARGARAAIGLPLMAEGQIVGAFILYGDEHNHFDDEEVALLEELAGDVSFALTFIAKEEQIDFLAYYDTLTGLPNRSLFFDRLAQQLGAAERDGEKLALALIDLDRFRMVNDTLGRREGDALLAGVARRLHATLRDQDAVARVGADSFAFAVTGNWTAESLGHLVDDRLRTLFGPPFLIGNEELRVSATAGVATFPDDGGAPEALFANAEAALRKAKEQNTRALFYSPEMNARVADSLRLETRLRRALENGEMALWYQPKIDMRSGRLAGLEALMRWNDPDSGVVPPGKFIPLMEQTGLILDAGRWAMDQIGRDCAAWSGCETLPRVAVNVSPLQLLGSDFIATVTDAAQRLQEHGASLDLEITETVIMENVAAITAKLQTVSGLGVQIAVDDFGTGYSSLAYIARLPIQALKIDRSFVAEMIHSPENLAIVKSVISLAHALRLTVVAEGVETEEQAAQLQQLGCDEGQGYLYSRPVPSQDVPALCRRFA